MSDKYNKKRKNTIDTYFNKNPRVATQTESIYNEITEQPISMTIEDCSDANEYIFTSDYDISLFVKNKLTTPLSLKNKIDVLQNVWIPHTNFKFPSRGSKNLKFQYKWFDQWNWLSHSKKEEAAYCKYCILFGPEEGDVGKQKLGKLVLSPFNNWKHAIEIFKEHDQAKYHKNSYLCSEDAVKAHKRADDSIDILLDKAKKYQRENNRRKIIPIIDTIIL